MSYTLHRNQGIKEKYYLIANLCICYIAPDTKKNLASLETKLK